MGATANDPYSPHTYRDLRDLAGACADLAEAGGHRVRADVRDQEVVIRGTHATRWRGRILATLARRIENQDQRAVTMVGAWVEHPEHRLCRTADLLAVTGEAWAVTRGARAEQPDDHAVFAPDVSVAVEVVPPSGPGSDHVTKLRDYPRMGVPVCVVVDPRDGTVTVHSGPGTASGEPRYAGTPQRYAFGDTVPMGPWSVDTANFPRYK
ncbi:Uma2 family endonuclease [Streptomyces sp. G45]|uniref:Uma2 family endonuclease n=1 Tax=Streptomyces sp. G45 TaxID=3406627 RepID=UPI003C265CB8